MNESPEVTPQARRALTSLPTVLGFDLIEGRPGGPNNDAILIRMEEGPDIKINAYSGGTMLIETVGRAEGVTKSRPQSALVRMADFEALIIPNKREPLELNRVGGALSLYQSNALAGEAGEVANEVKKMVRDRLQFHETGALEECGDVLFYMARLLKLYGYTIEDAAKALLTKLGQEWPV